MKKYFKVILVLVRALSIYNAAEVFAAQEGVLRVRTESSFPPFVFRDDSGNVAGIDAYHARSVA